MSDFMKFVFSYLVRTLALLIPAVVVCGASLIVAARLYKKKYKGERKFPWKKALLLLALAGYLSVVCYVTLFRAGHVGARYANMHLFRAWREAWNNFSEKNWMNILLNIAMFVPLGVLLPLMKKWFRKWYIMLPTGFLTTLAVESIQYFSYRGVFDVDDLFGNTLGAMIGFWAVMVILNIHGKQWKKAACHGLALIVVIGAIGGVFIAYDAQEYGNLATSPSFRVNTKDIQWTVDCEMDNGEQTVDIYKTETATKESCEAFGREFMGNLGIEDFFVTIYNEEVYLRENQGSRWMSVYYQGGHYSYTDMGDWDIINDVYGEVAEAELRAELLKLGIEIPAEAEFSYDEDAQVHYFRVSCHMDGDTMTDGAVAVQWEEGYGIREIDNDMMTFTYYGEAEIISEQAAAERLMAGWIASGEWLERKNAKQIEILSCELSWQVDTKGFYQPVYLFELKSADTNYEITEIVPAMK